MKKFIITCYFKFRLFFEKRKHNSLKEIMVELYNEQNSTNFENFEEMMDSSEHGYVIKDGIILKAEEDKVPEPSPRKPKNTWRKE